MRRVCLLALVIVGLIVHQSQGLQVNDNARSVQTSGGNRFRSSSSIRVTGGQGGRGGQGGIPGANGQSNVQIQMTGPNGHFDGDTDDMFMSNDQSSSRIIGK